MSYHSNPTYISKAPPKKQQIILINAILNNKAYLFEVSYWLTLAELKRTIEKTFAIPVAQQRLFYQSQELKQNNASISTIGGRKKIKLILRPTPTLENTLGLVKNYETLPTSENIEALLFSVQEGFNLGLIPELTFNGTSGAYFLRNKYRKNIAVFKPFDEEPFAPNNPKEYKGKLGMQGFKKGVLSGESAIREASAFLLDSKGFSGVPYTTFVEIVHPYFSNRNMKDIEISNSKQNSLIPIPNYSQYTDQDKKLLIKHGSLQKFVDNAEEAGDYGYKLFPDSEVRKIALLDIRILNCDRNEGNILVQKEKGYLKLVPIDHGLSFPDCFEVCTYDVVWMEWPQVQKGWTSAELDYISNINPKADSELLSKHFKFRDICLRNFRIAETVLKKCALSGLSLFEIGTLLYREDPDVPSSIEILVRKTEDVYKTMISSTPKEILLKLTRTEKEKMLKRMYKDNQDLDDSLEVRSRFKTEELKPVSQSAYNNKQILPHLIKAENKDTIESELFTIPEIETSSPQDLPGSKREFSFREGCVQVPSDYSHEQESDKDHSSDEENGKKGQDGTLTNGRTLKRSNSIPSGMRRTSSCEEEKKEAEECGSPEKKPSKKCINEKKQNRFNKELKMRKDALQQNNEIFFRYFESLLDQKIEQLMKNSKNSKQTRVRFMSDF